MSFDVFYVLRPRVLMVFSMYFPVFPPNHGEGIPKIGLRKQVRESAEVRDLTPQAARSEFGEQFRGGHE